MYPSAIAFTVPASSTKRTSPMNTFCMCSSSANSGIALRYHSLRASFAIVLYALSVAECFYRKFEGRMGGPLSRIARLFPLLPAGSAKLQASSSHGQQLGTPIRRGIASYAKPLDYMGVEKLI